MDNRLEDLDTAAAVLSFARGERAAADAAEVRQLRAAVAWAGMHRPDSITGITDVAVMDEAMYAETGIHIAGPGAPVVAEFCVPTFATALGMSTDTGRCYLGEAIELAHRLPRLYARVLSGKVVVWRARRVAKATIGLPAEGAAFVDHAVAGFAGTIGVAQLDRVIEEAMIRYAKAKAEDERRRAADGRRFDLPTRQVTFAGTVHVDAELDLADAIDLDHALRHVAATRAALGSTESLDVRRSQAAGDLARRQLTLDLNTPTPIPDTTDSTPDPTPDGPAGPVAGTAAKVVKVVKARQVVLYVHLSRAALDTLDTLDAHSLDGEGGVGVGRVENTRSMVSAEQIRQWCGNPDTQVTIRPVIDLNDHVHVEGYETPDRLREQVILINVTCVPALHQTRESLRLRPHHPPREGWADLDGQHRPVVSWPPPAQDPHRVDLHPDRGRDFVWTDPYGHRYRRDHTGTTDVTPGTPGTPPET